MPGHFATLAVHETALSVQPEDRPVVERSGGRSRYKELMNPVVTELIDHCTSCGLPLPLRRVRPGEVGSSWVCMLCGARIFGVFDDELNPSALGNVTPAEDVDPRVLLDGEVIATMFRRSDRPARVFEERRLQRKETDNDVTVMIGARRVAGRLQDLSAGGIGLLTREALEINADVEIQFDRSVGRPVRRCVIKSSVSQAGGEFRVGAEFVG